MIIPSSKEIIEESHSNKVCCPRNLFSLSLMGFGSKAMGHRLFISWWWHLLTICRFILLCVFICKPWAVFLSSATPGCAACALVTGAPSACVRTSSTLSCCRRSGPNSTLLCSEGPFFTLFFTTLSLPVVTSQICPHHHLMLVPFISPHFGQSCSIFLFYIQNINIVFLIL